MDSKYQIAIMCLILFTTVYIENGVCAKLYILDDTSASKKASTIRLRRQTHPAATVARIPTQDSVFIPIVGPTQFSFSPPPPQDGADLVNLPDTLVDYLVPPNPNAQISSLNFQDPSANLQNLDNAFEVSSTHTLPAFPSSPTFANQLILPSTQATATNDQVQSTFQNAAQPLQTSPSQSSPTFNFASKEASFSNQLNNLPSFNQTILPSSKSESLPQFERQQQQPSQGKWELGFDANDILTPPQSDVSGVGSEYDTINVPRFKSLVDNGNVLGNNIDQTGQVSPPVVQIGQPQVTNPNRFVNQFNQQNPDASPSNHFPSHFNDFQSSSFHVTDQSPAKEVSDANVVWGTQKQITPTTPTPFLPTIPASVQQDYNNAQNAFNTNGQDSFSSSNAQNTFNSQNTQNTFDIPNAQPTSNHPNVHSTFNPTVVQPVFNTPNQAFNPPRFQNPQPNHPFHVQVVNQNFPHEEPFTANFDTFPPQGTVADHTFPISENGRQLHKRETRLEEDDEEEDDRQQEEQKSKYRPGPVYSFVKTDKNGHFKWSVRHSSRK